MVREIIAQQEAQRAEHVDQAHAAIGRATQSGIPWWTLPHIPGAVLVRGVDVAACPFLSILAGTNDRDCWCSHEVIGVRTLAVLGRALAFLEKL